MKKIILLSATLLFIFQIVSGQKRSTQHQKFSASKNHFGTRLQTSKKTQPSVSSVWMPAKMVESVWDTVGNSWVFNDSVKYSYNINGDITLATSYTSTSPGWQQTSTYNAGGKLISSIGKNWNGSGWDNVYQSAYTYDANGNMTQQSSQQWVVSVWENDFKMDYTYDANNNQTQYIAQQWNTSTSAWENNYKENITYNAGNQILQMSDQVWNVSVWENDWKEDVTYNGSGVLVSAIDQIWNGSSWDNDVQYINVVFHLWTGDIYSSLLQSFTGQTWNGSGWDDSFRVSETYDAKNNEIDYYSEAWQTSVWVKDYEYKDAYLYDVNNNITQDIYQDWVDWMSAVRNSWKYYYSGYTAYSSVHENASLANGVIVYPNPSSDNFTVELQTGSAELKIYDVFGRQISATEIAGGKSVIETASFPAGIYFLKVSTNEGYCGKTLIRK